ncbi:hypothetical protein THAOC_00838, partial [Thalassiosira oceanica]
MGFWLDKLHQAKVAPVDAEAPCDGDRPAAEPSRSRRSRVKREGKGGAVSLSPSPVQVQVPIQVPDQERRLRSADGAAEIRRRAKRAGGGISGLRTVDPDPPNRQHVNREEGGQQAEATVQVPRPIEEGPDGPAGRSVAAPADTARGKVLELRQPPPAA